MKNCLVYVSILDNEKHGVDVEKNFLRRFEFGINLFLRLLPVAIDNHCLGGGRGGGCR